MKHEKMKITTYYNSSIDTTDRQTLVYIFRVQGSSGVFFFCVFYEKACEFIKQIHPATYFLYSIYKHLLKQ